MATDIAGTNRTDRLSTWPLVLTALAASALLAGAGWTLHHLVASRRAPRLRDSASWSAAEARTLLREPGLHWCDGQHGHVPGRGEAGRCLGRFATVLAPLARRLEGEPELVELFLELVERHPEPGIAGRAAEALGQARVQRARAALLRRAERERDLVALECLAWALLAIGAREACPALLPDLEAAGPYRLLALAVLGDDAVRSRLRGATAAGELHPRRAEVLRLVEAAERGALPLPPSPHRR